jgi:hypothetical protein
MASTNFVAPCASSRKYDRAFCGQGYSENQMNDLCSYCSFKAQTPIWSMDEVNEFRCRFCNYENERHPSTTHKLHAVGALSTAYIGHCDAPACAKLARSYLAHFGYNSTSIFGDKADYNVIRSDKSIDFGWRVEFNISRSFDHPCRMQMSKGVDADTLYKGTSVKLFCEANGFDFAKTCAQMTNVFRV